MVGQKPIKLIVDEAEGFMDSGPCNCFDEAEGFMDSGPCNYFDEAEGFMQFAPTHGKV